MTRRSLFTSLFFLLPVLYYLSIPASTIDLAIWIAQGRYLLEHREILRHDVFSVLPTGDLIYPIGSSVLYGILDRLGGLLAVSLFHKLGLLLYLVVIYFSSLKKLTNPWSPGNLALIAFSFLGAASICVDRPAEFAILPFIATYLILDEKGPLSVGRRFALTALTIAWVNIHGSWILLPMMFAWRILVGTILRTDSVRNFKAEALTGTSIVLASLANPFLFRIYPYLFQTALISRERGIDEWAVTWITPYFPQGLLFFGLAAGALVFVGRGIRTRNLDILESPFFLLTLLGLSAIRNTVWPFLALIPFAVRTGLTKTENAPSAEKPRVMNATIFSACLAITILMLPYFKPRIAPWLPAEKRAVFDASAPFGAAVTLQSRSGPIFNDWNYGGFLAYAQKNPIFIDSRNTIYSDQDFKDYLDIVNAAPDWKARIEHYGIRFVLLDRQIRRPLIDEIQKQPLDWAMIWENENSILFERRN